MLKVTGSMCPNSQWHSDPGPHRAVARGGRSCMLLSVQNCCALGDGSEGPAIPNRTTEQFLVLVGGLEHVLFSIISGIILPIDFHIFQDG